MNTQTHQDRDPRLPEDPRLLFVARDGVTHLVTNEGSLVPLEAVKEYFSGRNLSDISSDELKIPRGLVTDNLEGLPDINDKRFLDRDLIGRDNREFVTLFDIRRDVYSGRDLDGKRGVIEEIVAEAQTIVEAAAKKDVSEVRPAIRQPMAIFPGGIAGSGKGRVVKTAMDRFGEGNYFLIHRDGMRPERSFLYNVATNHEVGEHETDYRYIHDLFSKYHEAAIKEAAARKVNIIKDGSLNDGSNILLFRALHEAGYYTQARFMMVELEAAMKRNKERFGDEVRVVPENVFIENARRVFSNISMYMASPYVDSVVIIDNTVPRDKPKPILARVTSLNEIELWELMNDEKARHSDTVIINLGKKSDEKRRVVVVYDPERMLHFFDDIQRHSKVDASNLSVFPLATIIRARGQGNGSGHAR